MHFKYILLASIVLNIPHSFAAEISPPSEITPDVRFWEMVFGKYKSTECVFHDSRYLDVIYGVKKVGLRSPAQERRIGQTRDRIEDVLKDLRYTQDPKKDSFAAKVLAGIPAHRRNRNFFATAPDYIRCQQGVKESFTQGLNRSRSMIRSIQRELAARGLPKDLAYLPYLESGYNPRAHSKVGARGLWQLMPHTAREQGLRVNGWRDDRLDVRRATQAAINILEDNYRSLGSWPLAMTAYNYGINGIKRGIHRLGSSDYVYFRQNHRSPSFGFAARNFFPSFIAVRNLAKRAERDLVAVQ